MVRPLENRRALVTGAAGGIGGATCRALADAGARVAGLDRVAMRNGAELFVETDLTSEANIIAGVAAAARAFGGIDILVNNAGIMREAGIREVTAQDIDLHFAVNVRAAILVTRETLKFMGTGGRIINVASELAYLGRQNASVYVATKAAILGFTRSLARELAPDILVNAVAPGPTDTPLLGFEGLTESQQALELANPLGRIGRPEEIAAGIVYLAGPGAGFVTGHCLGINGGAAMV
jgi:3-oxoacyl-[acyl-carrier protein] reductase